MEAHFRHLRSKKFSWYKELFNPMSFDPCNCSLKSSGIHQDSNSQNESSFGSVEVHFLTLSFTFPGAWNVILGLHSWLARLQTFALVVSPRLRLWHVRYSTLFLKMWINRWRSYIFKSTYALIPFVYITQEKTKIEPLLWLNGNSKEWKTLTTWWGWIKQYGNGRC